jgi:hypothetical protein
MLAAKTYEAMWPYFAWNWWRPWAVPNPSRWHTRREGEGNSREDAGAIDHVLLREHREET